MDELAMATVEALVQARIDRLAVMYDQEPDGMDILLLAAMKLTAEALIATRSEADRRMYEMFTERSTTAVLPGWMREREAEDGDD